MTEEVRTTSATGGQKGVKPQRYDLLPKTALDVASEVYAFGAEKYTDHNWRRRYEWSKSYSAAQRHLTAWWDGEDVDPESGLSHLGHAMFHLFAMATWEREDGSGVDNVYDDRWPHSLVRAEEAADEDLGLLWDHINDDDNAAGRLSEEGFVHDSSLGLMQNQINDTIKKLADRMIVASAPLPEPFSPAVNIPLWPILPYPVVPQVSWGNSELPTLSAVEDALTKMPPIEWSHSRRKGNKHGARWKKLRFDHNYYGTRIYQPYFGVNINTEGIFTGMA